MDRGNFNIEDQVERSWIPWEVEAASIYAENFLFVNYVELNKNVHAKQAIADILLLEQPHATIFNWTITYPYWLEQMTSYEFPMSVVLILAQYMNRLHTYQYLRNLGGGRKHHNVVLKEHRLRTRLQAQINWVFKCVPYRLLWYISSEIF